MAPREAGPDTDGPFDIIVIGSGAGGLTAALTALHHRLRVLVVEKAAHVGGTSAHSGGAIWIPCNPVMAAAGIEDSPELARQYLGNVIGNRLRPEHVDAYIANGGPMVALVHARTEHRFHVATYVTDYFSETEGALPFGRSLGSNPMDGRRLGRIINMVRPTIAQNLLLGGLPIDFADLPALMSATRSLSSFLKTARLVATYGRDLIRHGRSMYLPLGQALVGGLLKGVLDGGGTVWLSAPASELVVEAGRVTGVVVHREGRPVTVAARRGVILASGGFANDPALRQAHFPGHHPHPTMSVPESAGDGLRMGLAAGGHVGGDLFQPYLGYPISVMRDADGTETKSMHMGMNRAKPGSIAVNERGERFLNEAQPYNNFTQAFEASGCQQGWFLADEPSLRKYGMGLIRPGPPWLRRLARYRRAGYLVSAPTIEQLATHLGIDPAALRATVDRFNRLARDGADPDFGRGATRHDTGAGDPAHQPNPNLGPLQTGPFHAIRVLPGNLGTWKGLETDARGRVLGSDGQPVPGAYACGLDAHAIFSGVYPGGGSSIGPAMTYGYIAARDLAGVTGPD